MIKRLKLIVVEILMFFLGIVKFIFFKNFSIFKSAPSRRKKAPDPRGGGRTRSSLMAPVSRVVRLSEDQLDSPDIMSGGQGGAEAPPDVRLEAGPVGSASSVLGLGLGLHGGEGPEPHPHAGLG